MTDKFKQLTELLAKGMNFEDNAVVMTTLIDGKASYFEQGRLSDILALIGIAIHHVYMNIDNEHDRDVVRDYFIEMLNKEVGVER